MDFISEKEPRGGGGGGGGGSLEARLCREITAIQEVVYKASTKKSGQSSMWKGGDSTMCLTFVPPQRLW